MLQGRKGVGHPVDVATGTVYSTHEDIHVSGKYRLKWDRLYSIALLDMPHTPLGPGWTTCYFATLTQKEDGFHLLSPEGAIEIFSDPNNIVARGGTVQNLGTFQELTKSGDRYIVTRWNVESDEIERYVFKEGRKAQAWPMTSIEDVSGQGVNLLRDELGRLTGIQQRIEKRILHIEYTSSNRVSSVSLVLPNNRRKELVHYDYDEYGRLSTAYNALGHADRYEYDDSSRLTRERLKDSGDFYFKYDDKGRCIKTSGLDGYDEKTFRYLDHIGWTEVTNSLGHVTRFQWLPTGQVICEVDPLGAKKQTEYDEHGRIIAKIDANGATKRFKYDDQGNRCKTIDPLGHEYLLTFNDAHQALMLTNPAGSAWKREYDASCRLVVAEDPLGGRWTLSYDKEGNLVIVNLNGALIRQIFSANGVLREATDAAGHVTRYRFDEFGRVVERLGPMGNATRYCYDLLGNLLAVTRPDGSEITYSYDSNNNFISITDRNRQITRYHHGTCKRLLKVTNSLGATIALEWGAEPGRLLTITNAKGECYRFDYDANGRVIQETGFDGRKLHFEYDAAGNRIARINGLNERISYKVDPLGRTLEIVLPDDNRSTYRYDELSNVIFAANDQIEIRFERDKLGRILREYQGKHIINYEYNVAGNLTQTTTSLSHQVNYAFDSRNLLSRLTVNELQAFEFIRDTQGHETRRLLPHSLILEQRVDNVGRLLNQRVAAVRGNATSLRSFSKVSDIERTYSWSATCVTRIRDSRWGMTNYVYDPVEQLIRTVREKGAIENFNYDAAGNIISVQQNGSEEVLKYGAGNRLFHKGNISYFYDDEGRLTRKVEKLEGRQAQETKKEWYYQWDTLDQLCSLTTPKGEVWKYRYDPFGRRISKEGPNRTIFFMWDRDVIIHELDNYSAPITWIFDVHTFKPLGKIQNGRVYSVITDHLGTPRELIDPNGQIVWSGDYSSWGSIDEERSSEVDCPIRFQGQWYDEETDLHYSRFRYYDPMSGRFISQDPIGLKGGVNLYQYGPNPINWIDPLGLDWNYVVVDSAGNPRYSGVASDNASQSSVEYRHGQNIGNDDQARFDSTRGDRLVPITPRGTDHETARGMEQRIAGEFGTVIGRQGSEGNNVNGGSVRGNNQNPVDQNDHNSIKRDSRASMSQDFLDENETSTRRLVEDAMEESEDEC